MCAGTVGKKRTGAEHEAARAVHDCGLHRGIDVGVVSNEISLERICGKIAVPWLLKAVAQRFCVGGGRAIMPPP